VHIATLIKDIIDVTFTPHITTQQRNTATGQQDAEIMSSLAIKPGIGLGPFSEYFQVI
jgi:hypothetical protein